MISYTTDLIAHYGWLLAPAYLLKSAILYGVYKLWSTRRSKSRTHL